MFAFLQRVPIVAGVARRLHQRFRRARFESGAYWESRYGQGGNSGDGSYGVLAAFKAEFLNDFVRTHGIRTVLEFGCGDGNQLTLAAYPQYLGYDVSRNAIARCRALFAQDATKRFRTMEEYRGETAELTLSLDVIYHLVEDSTFEDYMHRLFCAAERFAIIYSSNFDERPGNAPHVRHRQFTSWIAANVPGWQLVSHVRNRYPYDAVNARGSHADFFVFAKK